MPLNAQDLWVVLKAQDMATRALNAYSRSVRTAGSETRMANIQAAQGALQNELAAKRLAQSYERAAISALQDERATIRLTLAQKQQLRLSAAQEQALRARDTQIQGEIISRQRNITALDNESNSIRRNILQYDQEAQRIKTANARLAEHKAKLIENSNKYKALAQSMYAASFTVTALGVVGASALKSAITAAADYDTQVRKTFTQVDKGKTTLKELGDIGVKIATQIGVKFEDVQASLYDVFSSMDVSVQDATKYVTLFAKAAVAGQTDIDSVSRGTIAILNSFKLKAGDLNHVLDLQFEFIRKGVGTYDEWVTKLGAVAPSAIRAGQSLETMFAALAEASRMSGVAAKASTAVARALDVISHPKAVAAMKELGINALDAKGNLRPLADVLTDIKTRLDKIPDRNKRLKAFLDIIKGSGGTIEARRFLTNMIMQEGTLEDFKNILKDTANASGALNDAYGTMADGTQTKTQLLKNRFHALWMEVGQGLIPYFNKLLDMGSKVAQWLGNLSPKTKEMATKFLAWATAAALIVGPILGILGVIGSLTGALAALGLGLGEVLLIIAAVALAIAGLVTFFVKGYEHSQKFRETLGILRDRAKEVWKILKDFAADIQDAFDKKLKPALMDLAKAFETYVMPIIKDLIDLYTNNLKNNLKDFLDKMKSLVTEGFDLVSSAIRDKLIPVLKDINEFYHRHKSQIDAVITAMQWLGKWILIIAGGAVIGFLIGTILTVIAVFVFLAKAAMGVVEFWQMMSKKAIELTHTIGKVAHEIWDKFVEIYNAAKDNIKKAIDYVAGLPGKIKEFFSDARNWLVSAAADVIRGFIDGLVSHWDELVNKLKELAKKLPKPVREVLGIESPSKVFAKIGRYTVLGYIKGIADMEGPLGRAVSNMTGTMMGGKYAKTSYLGSYGSNYSQTAGATGGRTSNVTVNVTTNELRPEYHSARLGQLLAGRVGG